MLFEPLLIRLKATFLDLHILSSLMLLRKIPSDVDLKRKLYVIEDYAYATCALSLKCIFIHIAIYY
jgi:hypothetical protein